MNIKVLILTISICLTPAHAQEVVKGVMFDAEFFDHGNVDKPGIIVLAGSGMGKDFVTSKRLYEMGYNVLALAYYDSDSNTYVSETLEMIPLEYFDAPKKWLSERSNGIILFGLSKGAELALVLASYDPNYKGIVALAPSNVVWQGFPKDFSKIMQSPSSWSKDGKGLSFVPYISREEQNKLGIDNRHAASLTNASAVHDALIKVEDIKSPILLLSGGEDKSWPSETMANDICNRVGNNCTHKSYPEGDHLLSEHKNEMFTEVDKFLGGVR